MGKMAKITLGWREWVALPQLGVAAVRAKIDTGARTSALHADAIELFSMRGRERVRFLVHPAPGVPVLACTADLLDRRRITDSGGHAEMRYVIRTDVCLGGVTWPIELGLATRPAMRFRMLLGRTAVQGRFVIDPSKSYVAAPAAPER